MIDEFNRKTISKALDDKVKQYEGKLKEPLVSLNSEEPPEESEERVTMAYKEMPNWIYFASTTLVYVTTMSGAVFIGNIGLIF